MARCTRHVWQVWHLGAPEQHSSQAPSATLRGCSQQPSAFREETGWFLKLFCMFTGAGVLTGHRGLSCPSCPTRPFGVPRAPQLLVSASATEQSSGNWEGNAWVPMPAGAGAVLRTRGHGPRHRVQATPQPHMALGTVPLRGPATPVGPGWKVLA